MNAGLWPTASAQWIIVLAKAVVFYPQTSGHSAGRGTAQPALFPPTSVQQKKKMQTCKLHIFWEL